MTAYPSRETAQDSFRMHAVDYLVNPLKQGGLLNSVNKALEQFGKMEPVRQIVLDNGNRKTIRKEREVFYRSLRESCLNVDLIDRSSKRREFGRTERWTCWEQFCSLY